MSAIDRPSNAVNALIHLYRAEVGRLVAYRTRLDTTTNWAVTTAAIITTFALGNPEVTHAAFLFLMVVTYFFLHIEARRLRYYEVIRHRVQVMERCFYSEVLGRDVDPHWTEALAGALEQPASPISHLDAIGWRLRRNYIWIYATIVLIWLNKLGIVRASTLDAPAIVSVHLSA